MLSSRPPADVTKPKPRRLDRTLAQRVQEVADAKGISVNRLSQRSRISRSDLWALLTIKRSETLGTVERVAAALEVDPSELLIATPARGTAIASPSWNTPARARRRRPASADPNCHVEHFDSLGARNADAGRVTYACLRNRLPGCRISCQL